MATRRPDVCFLNARFFPIGGTAIRTLNFARAIKNQVNGVRIITWQPLDDSPDETKVLDLAREGISIDILPISHQFLRKHFRLLYVLTFGFEYLLFVRKIAETENVDVIQCGNETIWIGVLLKKILRRPIIADLHAKPTATGFNVLPDAANRLLQFLSKVALRIANNLIDGFVCPTEELRNFLVSWGLSASKVVVIPNAISASTQEPKKSKTEIRAELGLDKGTILVAFHGILVEHYNIDALNKLSTISKIVSKDVKRKIKFMIIGYHQEIQVEDENFIYTGYVENLFDYLRAADFALVPIFEDSLGIRSRLLDYFKVSLPVITTPVGVTGMRFAQYSGAVIVRSDIEGLAQSAVELVNSPEKLKGMANKTTKLAEMFSPEKIAERLLSFYSQTTRQENVRRH